MEPLLRDLIQDAHSAAGHEGPVEWCSETGCIEQKEALAYYRQDEIDGLQSEVEDLEAEVDGLRDEVLELTEQLDVVGE